jgi:MgtC family protein
MRRRWAGLTDMQIRLADPLFGGAVQNGRHLIELFAAFGLTTLIGLERTTQGKSAGLRTQTIVGMSSALILLISKYGFGEVLAAGTIVLDPSHVAAQIVSGIGAGARRHADGGGFPDRRSRGEPVHHRVESSARSLSTWSSASSRQGCAGQSGYTSSTKAAGVYCGSCCGPAGSENGSSPNSTRTRTISNAIRSG